MKYSYEKDHADEKYLDKIKTFEKFVNVDWSTSITELDCFTLKPYK